jgi:hypothetical protein
MRCRSIRRLDLRPGAIVHKAEKLSPGKKRHANRGNSRGDSLASVLNAALPNANKNLQNPCFCPGLCEAVEPLPPDLASSSLPDVVRLRPRVVARTPGGREFRMRTGAIAQSHPPVKWIWARLQPPGIHDVARVESALDCRDHLYAELRNVRRQPR